MGSMGLIFMLPLMMLVVLDPNIRTAMGGAVGGLFTPVFGFGGQFPVWTLFITSVVLVIFTTVVRHFFTNWVAMGRQKHTSTWVQKQYREIRLKGNVTTQSAVIMGIWVTARKCPRMTEPAMSINTMQAVRRDSATDVT
jgi:uncharacterized membrane protein (DUF106 family)